MNWVAGNCFSPMPVRAPVLWQAPGMSSTVEVYFAEALDLVAGQAGRLIGKRG